ncbi:acetoin catabolism protein AcoB [Spirochaetia bacterium]|nr:acetoin catabolism protein AcoB [Spirochaetia bacterium]
MDYIDALYDALTLLLDTDDDVCVIGQNGIARRFCTKYPTRVFDTPVSEAGTYGMAIGASMVGIKPIVYSQKMDFMYLALDQIVNECSAWRTMFNGKIQTPIVFRGMVDRGAGSQHSQSPVSLYAHIPDIKVVCPATAYDVKGLLIAAVNDPGPVMFIDDVWLYHTQSEVPQGLYEVPIGKANVVKEGADITIIALSYLVPEAVKAAEALKGMGIHAEVIDLRSVKPLDTELLIRHVQKTGRAMVAVCDWGFCGLDSYIASVLYENCFNVLKAPIGLVSFPDKHVSASAAVEKKFYPHAEEIKAKALKVLS